MFWLAGHSKGAGSVLLYSSKHDDIPNVVNVAGRFDMCRGVKERFGEDIIERLASEKQIPMKGKRDDGTKIEWKLTKWSLQDRLNLNMATVCTLMNTCAAGCSLYLCIQYDVNACTFGRT